MHPAISVIFFTVTSGAGFGLIALIGLGWPMRDGMLAVFLACALAAGLAVAGLISSTFHLGHPERAWRAFSQWRSSWLSREGVLAVATLALFGVYGLVWMLSGERIAPLGYLIALLAVATVISTGMIYASLKTVRQWHSVLTPLCYLGFAMASALPLATAIGTEKSPRAIIAALAALAVAWLLKLAWWRRAFAADFMPGSDAGTATGLGSIGKVRLLERPHSGENYLTKEMVHRVGRKHARALRMISGLAGFAISAVFLGLALIGLPGLFLSLAFASLIAGLFAERWLFFAEARHSVSLYY
ncbi:MAG: dimethyl sulfoxide reductase anchor subunit [Nitratireductor sp.]|jgi:DMSO reductase anchor subunit|nr:dimethyl sulfoxide reductase anchor subunit [Nitratireductor sp.]